MNKYKGLVLTDVDGVLTNNTVGYCDCGRRIRFFNLSDGYGFQLLKDAGYLCIMLSGENDDHIRHRANKLGVRFIHTPDKLAIAKRIVRILDMSWDRVAFMGNDVPDIPLLSVVGHPACPIDAHFDMFDLVCKKQGFISRFGGGNGAFREWASVIAMTTL